MLTERPSLTIPSREVSLWWSPFRLFLHCPCHCICDCLLAFSFCPLFVSLVFGAWSTLNKLLFVDVDNSNNSWYSWNYVEH